MQVHGAERCEVQRQTPARDRLGQRRAGEGREGGKVEGGEGVAVLRKEEPVGDVGEMSPLITSLQGCQGQNSSEIRKWLHEGTHLLLEFQFCVTNFRKLFCRKKPFECLNSAALVELLRDAEGSEKCEDGWHYRAHDHRLSRFSHRRDGDEKEGGGGEEIDSLVLLLDERRRAEARDRQDLECGGGARQRRASCDNLRNRRVCERNHQNLE